MFKKGEKVLAYADGEERIGFVLVTTADGDGKNAVQVGGDVHALTYREPDDYDAHGSGGTFRKLG